MSHDGQVALGYFLDVDPGDEVGAVRVEHVQSVVDGAIGLHDRVGPKFIPNRFGELVIVMVLDLQGVRQLQRLRRGLDR